jgi:hypothetical protein
MEKYISPFFGTEGLTSTSANHIANVAKEHYESLEEELAAINFVEESISVVGTIDKTISVLGTPDILDKVESYLAEISELKAFIAWLREAIKKKESFTKELSFYRSEEYANLEMPMRPQVRTQDEILSGWDIKDRERYLTLEAECAVIGKFIHPKGAYAKAKERLFKKLVAPIQTNENGRDTIITYYKPVVSKEDVEFKFFELQKKHRSAQAELNSLKSRLAKEETEEKDRLSREYMAALDEYNAKKQKLAELDKLYVEEERKKIESLKIVIPPHHRALYERINRLSKIE